MKRPARKTSVRVLVIAIFAIAIAASSAFVDRAEAQRKKPPAVRTARSKYSDFQHATKAHRMECGSCHTFPSANWNKVRDAKDAFPDITDYPKHESCLKCHQQQFFKGSPPAICTICHTNPGPRDSSRHPYPNPREIFDASAKGKAAPPSDLVVEFPHEKHIDIVAGHGISRAGFMLAAFISRRAEESCAVCHQTLKPQDKSDDEFLTKPPANNGDAFWLKKGTFKSAPIGHTACFTCHSVESGIAPAPSSCASCHQLRPQQPAPDFDPAAAKQMLLPEDRVMRQAWATRHSSGTFRHEWFSHAELACSTCHNVVTMKTSVPATTRVPISACATCHATPTSDDGGALNFEVDSRNKDPKFQCVKCHVTYGKLPVPASHIKALTEAAGK